jgi:hypothetical protein
LLYYTAVAVLGSSSSSNSTSTSTHRLTTTRTFTATAAKAAAAAIVATVAINAVVAIRCPCNDQHCVFELLPQRQVFAFQRLHFLPQRRQLCRRDPDKFLPSVATIAALYLLVFLTTVIRGAVPFLPQLFLLFLLPLLLLPLALALPLPQALPLFSRRLLANESDAVGGDPIVVVVVLFVVFIIKVIVKIVFLRQTVRSKFVVVEIVFKIFVVVVR